MSGIDSHLLASHPILAGSDGSPEARAAIAWAAKFAVAAQLPLVVVTVVPPTEHDELTVPGQTRSEDLPHPGGSHREGTQANHGLPSDVHLTARIEQGRPGERLVALSEEATLMVLGNRGAGGFLGSLLGSTSEYVALRAECPVVVVKSDHTATLGPVTAGLAQDSPPEGEHDQVAVWQAALSAARVLRRPAVGLHVVVPRLDSWAVATPVLVDWELEAMTRRRNLHHWLEAQPHRSDVSISEHVVVDSVGHALEVAGRDASLVVVGRHDHMSFAQRFLGDVAVHALRRSPAPVMIVPVGAQLWTGAGFGAESAVR